MGEVCAGVAAENFYEVTHGAEGLKGAFDFFIVTVSVKVDEKDIFPVAALGGTAFDHGKSDAFMFERQEAVVEGADAVAGGETDGGLVVAGLGGTLFAKDEEAGGVVGIVLDVLVDDVELIDFGGEAAGDGGGVILVGGGFGGTGIAGEFHQFGAWEVLKQPGAALSEGLGMAVDLADLRTRAFGEEAVADGEADFSADLDIGVDEHVKSVVDDPLGGVFDGDAAVVGVIGLDLAEDIGDAVFGGVIDTVTEFGHGGLMGIGGLGAEERDLQGTFEGEGTGHDLMVDGAEGLFLHGTLVEFGQSVKEAFLTFGDIDGGEAPVFELADFENVFIALIEQCDDLGVDPVDVVPQFLEIHILEDSFNCFR